jgi:hypothetical protein
VVLYHTLELRHPAFTQPIRVVRDHVDLQATLELTAGIDPGVTVLFVALAFDFTKPEVSASGVPQITITLDNVDRAMVANIEAAMRSIDLVEVIYREYSAADLSAPQNNPPLSMTITSVSADVFKVTAVAGFPNLMNRRFPSLEYSADLFPGLVP